MNLSTLFVMVVVSSGVMVGCGGASAPAQAPGEIPARPSAPPESTSSEAPPRPPLTVEECEASGGSVVGDIGDGAIHRPEYRCPNGAKPSGSIRAAEGGPIAIEGSVCCPK